MEEVSWGMNAKPVILLYKAMMQQETSKARFDYLRSGQSWWLSRIYHSLHVDEQAQSRQKIRDDPATIEYGQSGESCHIILWHRPATRDGEESKIESSVDVGEQSEIDRYIVSIEWLVLIYCNAR